VAHRSFLLLTFVFASTIAYPQTFSDVSETPQPLALDSPLDRGPLACSPQQHQTIVVPGPLIEGAKLKARLLMLLRDSLADDTRGIVNIAREKEIRRLANKLKSSRLE